MAKKGTTGKRAKKSGASTTVSPNIAPPDTGSAPPAPAAHPVHGRGRPSALLDTRVIYCGDCLEQLEKLPTACIDLIYIDPPFNSNRNYEVFWGETKEKHRGMGDSPMRRVLTPIGRSPMKQPAASGHLFHPYQTDCGEGLMWNVL
jgi:hypothetical protein